MFSKYWMLDLPARRYYWNEWRKIFWYSSGKNLKKRVFGIVSFFLIEHRKSCFFIEFELSVGAINLLAESNGSHQSAAKWILFQNSPALWFSQNDELIEIIFSERLFLILLDWLNFFIKITQLINYTFLIKFSTILLNFL